MEKIPRQVYTNEFRQQAVEMITRDGVSIVEAARRLVLSSKTLLNWVRRAKAGHLPSDNGDASSPFRFISSFQRQASVGPSAS